MISLNRTDFAHSIRQVSAQHVAATNLDLRQPSNLEKGTLGLQTRNYLERHLIKILKKNNKIKIRRMANVDSIKFFILDFFFELFLSNAFGVLL